MLVTVRFTQQQWDYVFHLVNGVSAFPGSAEAAYARANQDAYERKETLTTLGQLHMRAIGSLTNPIEGPTEGEE